MNDISSKLETSLQQTRYHIQRAITRRIINLKSILQSEMRSWGEQNSGLL